MKQFINEIRTGKRHLNKFISDMPIYLFMIIVAYCFLWVIGIEL